MNPHPYVTPGPRSAIAAACDAAGVPAGERGRVGSSRQFRAICSALTTLPEQAARAAAHQIDPATVPNVRNHIAALRAQLAAELDAADRYIAEVEAGIGLE